MFPKHSLSHPEAFTSKVMARLNDQQARRKWWSLEFWKVPALGLVSATVMALLLIQPITATPGIEDLLLADEAEPEIYKIALQPQDPQLDEVLAISMEE